MDYLNHRLLSFSQLDHYRTVEAVEGIFITGSPGSGKSSTFSKALAHEFLRRTDKGGLHMGGLVLTVKAEETRTWLQYAKDCGRSDDVILFNAESGHCFDPLFYEWNRPGRGAGDLESIIDIFTALLSISKPPTSGGGEDGRFFELAVEELMRAIIILLGHSSAPVSIVNIDKMIRSLPRTPDQHKTEEWYQESFCSAVCMDILDNRFEGLSDEQRFNVDLATSYVTQQWPNTAERTRSSVQMTWTGMASRFLFHPYNWLFSSGKCTFIPEMTTTQPAKIVICDFPILEFGIATGRLINCLLKICFMRAWLRRDVSQHPVPAYLWQDEGQMFLLGGHGAASRDNAFAQVARASRICTVFMTQNILNVAEALGANSPGSRTKSLLGNFALKVFHQQNDVDTNLYAANLLGKSKQYMRSISASDTAPSITHGEHMLYNVEPDEFTRLAKPDTINPSAEIIVYQGGKPFQSTIGSDNPKGKSYLKMRASR